MPSFAAVLVPDLQKCLNPAAADEMTLSDAAKTEIILSGTGQSSIFLYFLHVINLKFNTYNK